MATHSPHLFFITRDRLSMRLCSCCACTRVPMLRTCPCVYVMCVRLCSSCISALVFMFWGPHKSQLHSLDEKTNTADVDAFMMTGFIRPSESHSSHTFTVVRIPVAFLMTSSSSAPPEWHHPPEWHRGQVTSSNHVAWRHQDHVLCAWKQWTRTYLFTLENKVYQAVL